MKSVFVSQAVFLAPGGGGVQHCTREYLDTLTEAGIEPEPVGYGAAMDLPSRLLRRLAPAPYRGLHPRSLVTDILKLAGGGPATIFLNNTDAAALAPGLRAARGDLRLVFLSHGAEITDVVNTLHLMPEAAPPAHRSPAWIGKLVQTELAVRCALDGVVCISQEDLAVEQWLGTRHCVFLPRGVPTRAMDLKPVRGRIGTISTLNHAPNDSGIRALAALLPSRDLTLRLVGGPPEAGETLAREFSGLEYCGRLSDADLAAEAATWSAFVNPVFCQARGASTKVATALGWGLPVLTTPQGRRGYRWDDAALPVCETPQALADLARRVALEEDPDAWAEQARAVRKLAPSVEEAAAKLLAFLATVEKT